MRISDWSSDVCSSDLLDKRLGRLKDDKSSKLVIVEGIYSMLGDQAPLDEFVDVKRRHGVDLLVDEAHSLGVFGDHGRGIAEAYVVEQDVAYVVGTFSQCLGAFGDFGLSDNTPFERLPFPRQPQLFPRTEERRVGKRGVNS